MPNADRPHGAVPVQTFSGNPVRLWPYTVPSSQGTATFLGDLVSMTSSGEIAPAAAGDLVIIGVAQGALYLDGNNVRQFSKYLPASTAGTVLVAADPMQIFEIQSDDGAPTTDTVALTNIGNNADHVAGAGSTRTGISAHELDTSNLGTVTATFRVIGRYPKEDNTFSATVADGQFAKCLVLIIEHFLNQTTGV